MTKRDSFSIPGVAGFAALIVSIALAAAVPVHAQATNPPREPAPANAKPSAAVDELPRGVIVDRVVCAADLSQSYALYLPSTYTKERAWPIVYCFEPAARGRLPVEHFQAAAERFGWIVVTSWNSRNGSMARSVDAGSAMWRDTHERFRIDDRRVYTSGFSGGARVATLVAMSCGGCIAGVIACGAGFPDTVYAIEKQTPDKLRFAYFATVGVEDFNFSELSALGPTLERLNVTHRVARFEGAHEWAPSELLVEAAAWMEIEAIRSGARVTDAGLVDALYGESIARARALEAAGRVFDAWQLFESARRQYSGLRAVAEADVGARALAGDRRVKDSVKIDREEVKRQNRIAGEAAAWAKARQDQETRVEAIAEFRRRIEDLRTKARSKTESSERRVARRTLNLLFANYYEGGNSAALSGNHVKAVEMLEVAVEIAPRYAGSYFALAGQRFKTGDRRKAMESLGQGLEKLAEWATINAAAVKKPG